MRVTAILALITLVAGPASATDQTILGKQLQVKDPKPGVDATKRTVLAQGQEKNSPNTIVGDPTLAGATLTVFVGGTTPSSQTYTLPAALWTAVKTGFKYKDAALTMGPVKTAAITLAKGTFPLKAQAPPRADRRLTPLASNWRSFPASVITRGRPSRLPWARARRSPAFVLSTIQARSTSASTPTSANIALPIGDVRWSASRRYEIITARV